MSTIINTSKYFPPAFPKTQHLKENLSPKNNNDYLLKDVTIYTGNSNIIPSMYPTEDLRMLEDALGGGIKECHAFIFQKKYGQTIQSIMNATILELAEIRHSEERVGFGGLKKSGIKGWKFVVKLDEQKKILNLFIGIFNAQGGFTKVYLTLNNEAILFPKKGDIPKQQALHAYENICFLHTHFNQIEESSSKVFSELLHNLNFSKKVFFQLLPPIPLIFQASSVKKPIFIAPKATSAEGQFKKSPRNMQEVIYRIEIIRDVALGVAFAHEIGLVHGDLKPDNILINKEGRGQLHDLGGCKIFYTHDSHAEALLKYQNLAITTMYNHYQDLTAYKKFTLEKDRSAEIFKLGCARDVFALGVLTIEALLGMYNSKDETRMPFHTVAYRKVGANHFLNGPETGRRSIPYIKKISTKIDNDFQKLLCKTLQPNHTERLLAKEYAKGLNDICTELNSLLEA